jgi:GNAT superfamily N-acetyltransferase
MEMRIRDAEPDDIHDLVEMAIMFYETTHYHKTVDMSIEKAYELFNGMMADEHVLLVIESADGRLMGMIGLFIVPFMFAPIKMQAHEVIWWVNPRIQSSGMGGQLLDAAERACKDKGANAVQMIALASSPPQAHALYKSRGYEHTETTFVKEI